MSLGLVEGIDRYTLQMLFLLNIIVVPRRIVQCCYKVSFPVVVTEAKLRKSSLHFISILSSYCCIDFAPSFWRFANTVQACPEFASKPTHRSGPETVYDIPVLILDKFSETFSPWAARAFP
jgi:hypothetical protein